MLATRVLLGAAVRACAARPFLGPGLDHELDCIALKRLRVTLEIALRRRREVGLAYVCWQAGVEPTEAFEPEQAIKHPRDVRRAGGGFQAALTGVSQTGAVDPRRRRHWGEDDILELARPSDADLRTFDVDDAGSADD